MQEMDQIVLQIKKLPQFFGLRRKSDGQTAGVRGGLYQRRLLKDGFPLTIQILEISRKSSKKRKTDQVFYAFNMGIKINQCLKILNETDRNQVLPE